MPRLFPAEVMQESVFTWLPSVQPKSQIIYIIVLGGVVASLLASTFIKVDVSVNVAGIVRPLSEKTELRSLSSATIAEVLVTDGQPVKQGQLLLRLQQDMTNNKLDQASFELTQRETHMHDLALLAKGAGASSLSSTLYKQQYLSFQATVAERRSVVDRLKSDYQMYSKMYEEKVIAKKEFLDKKYAYEQARASYQAALSGQQSKWAEELEHLRLERRQLQAGKSQLQKEKDQLEIRAPVNGTVQQLAGRYAGGSVQAGELLGLVSPDSGMLAECLISPSDIGYIYPGMAIKCQVDAFNYNSWGILPGKVLSVDNDFTLVNNLPMFKVKCSLDNHALQLSNGVKGYLKKGMTMQCRFILTRRTLMQLLYERTDNWINPNAATKPAAS